MAEAVVVSGFVGVGIEKVINQIIRQIRFANSYKKVLGSLQRLVIDIQPIIKQIQRYRPALNRKNGIPTSQCYNKASAVNIWLRKLDLLLRQASEMVQRCTILPRYNVIFRYQSSRKISHLISDIKEHVELSPLVSWAQIPELLEELKQEIGQTMKESIEAIPSSSSSSATTSQSLASTGFFIPEPLIVGQERVFATLEKLVVGSEFSRIGVVGKGGSGKTLLLKRIFNSKKVRNLFSDGLLLWLTVSRFPCFKSLGKELCQQIAIQTKEHDLQYNMNPEGVKIWMNQSMQTKRFVLFLDDVWGEGAKLLEDLGLPLLTDHSTSKLIVSSRDHRALLEMGVNAEKSTIKMEDLIEDESWLLFAHHTFPYSNLAIQIAEHEENFYCRAGTGLTALIGNECSGRSRLFLNYNRLRSLPESLRAPEMSALMLGGNANIREIPRKVIGSMVSLKVLDLNGTSLRSLPESVGSLKQLVCLALVGVPITRLPASLTDLVSLEVLLLRWSKITELPSDIHRLRS